jgi:hypothetical protein
MHLVSLRSTQGRLRPCELLDRIISGGVGVGGVARMVSELELSALSACTGRRVLLIRAGFL